MWTRGGRTSLGCEAKAAFHRNSGMRMLKNLMVLHSVQASRVWAGPAKAKIEKSGDR